VPIVIGAKRESDFKDPNGMLGDCHRRIERFLNALLTVAVDAKVVPSPTSSTLPLRRACAIFARQLLNTQPMKKRACFQDCAGSTVPACNRSLRKWILSNRITNAPRRVTAR
jgi:hypothetical protein